MKNKFVLIFLTALSLSATAAIQLKSNPKEGLVEFEAIGRPSMLKIKGTGEGVMADLKIDNNMLSGKIQFSLKSLKTGIELRDEHMLTKYLQVDRFSEAQLVLTNSSLPKNFSLSTPGINNYPFKGILDLHGVKKEIAGNYSVDSAQLASNASFEIKLSDFNIDIPSYLGVKVADIVKIKVAINKIVKVN